LLLIGNGRLITRDDLLPYVSDGCVAIRDHQVIEVGPTLALKGKYPASEFLDARGRTSVNWKRSWC
jgi:hypothetical protein